MTDQHDPITEALRASLARHADDAPAGDLLAERIVARAERAPVSRRAGWRTWTLPLVAAGAVGAVVLAVVGIEHYRPDAGTVAAGTSGSAVVAPRPSATPSVAMSWVPATSATPSWAGGLRDVRVNDLTFVGAHDGWALASARCLKGSGRCTALLRTTDGRTWHGMPGAAFNTGGVGSCADPCVTHLRFANDQVGYAYGSGAFLMTTDGGATWEREPGGAEAVETLNDNVIRLVSDGAGCPGPCNVRVQIAAIGSTSWTTHRLDSAPVDVADLHLVRSGRYAVVTATRGGSGATPLAATLYRSSDRGESWMKRADPCPAPLTTSSIAAAGDPSVSVLCQSETRDGPARTLTSYDGGGTFVAGRPHRFHNATGLAAASSGRFFVMTDRGAFRSIDGGKTWKSMGAVAQSATGDWSFAGFQSTQVGRIVSTDGRTIWTTWDAGDSWSPTVLP